MLENIPYWVNLLTLPVIVGLLYFFEHRIAVLIEPRHIPKNVHGKGLKTWQSVSAIEVQLLIISVISVTFGIIFGMLEVSLWRVIIVECFIGLALLSIVHKQLWVPAAFLYEISFVVGELMVQRNIATAAVVVVATVGTTFILIRFVYSKRSNKS